MSTAIPKSEAPAGRERHHREIRMRSIKLKQCLHLLTATSVLLIAAGCGGGGSSPTGPGPNPDPQPGPGTGLAGDYRLARIGFISLPANLTVEDCGQTRFIDGGMRVYDDGTWEFAISIQNAYGDTRFDNGGSFEQAGGAVWLEADDGETFQATVDQDGVIAIDYDYCQNGETDMQLVFAR
jgi:hypothetical protein